MKLGQYRSMRDFAKTPEPAGTDQPAGDDHGSRFVVQEHHATALHWDVRFERDGVLVSWAVPKGLPPDPRENHLAVHTEDHPMEYLEFDGDIPEAEYGGGRVQLWDTGTYVTEKWEDREVEVQVKDDGIFQQKLPITGDPEREGGLGIALMMAMVDEFAIRQGTFESPGTLVRLRKSAARQIGRPNLVMLPQSDATARRPA